MQKKQTDLRIPDAKTTPMLSNVEHVAKAANSAYIWHDIDVNTSN